MEDYKKVIVGCRTVISPENKNFESRETWFRLDKSAALFQNLSSRQQKSVKRADFDHETLFPYDDLPYLLRGRYRVAIHIVHRRIVSLDFYTQPNLLASTNNKFLLGFKTEEEALVFISQYKHHIVRVQRPKNSDPIPAQPSPTSRFNWLRSSYQYVAWTADEKDNLSMERWLDGMYPEWSEFDLLPEKRPQAAWWRNIEKQRFDGFILLDEEALQTAVLRFGNDICYSDHKDIKHLVGKVGDKPNINQYNRLRDDLDTELTFIAKPTKRKR